MNEVDVHDLTRAMETLSARVASIERRMEVLEGARPHLPLPTAAPVPLPLEKSAAAPDELRFDIALTGRSLIALAGAFLLRALSTRGVFSDVAGSLLALAYAAFWLLEAGHAGRVGKRSSALYHALAAAAIAYPLVWEATARFHFWTTVASAAALGGLALLALGSAARSGMPTIAWIATTAMIAVTPALMIMTREMLPYLYALLVLRAAMALAGKTGHLIRWPVAFVLDATALLFALMALSEATPYTRSSELLFLLLFFADAAAALFHRVVISGKRIDWYTALQSTFALLVGVGAAIALERDGVVGFIIAALTAVLAVVAYFRAFARKYPESGRTPEFVFLVSCAGLALLIASPVAFGSAAPVVLSAAALGCAWHARTSNEALLANHSAVYILAAAMLSGTLSDAAAALAAPVSAWKPEIVTLDLVVLVVAFGSALLVSTVAARAAQIALWSIAALSACGTIITVAAIAYGHPIADAPLATLRTFVLAASSILVALAPRIRTTAPARSLLYPILVLAGVKLLFEDLRVGGPGYLVADFVLFGTALIVAPRLLARGPADPKITKDVGDDSGGSDEGVAPPLGPKPAATDA